MLRIAIFVALFAVVVYAGFWLLDRRKGGGRKKAAKPIPRGPVGPDDDEDFLRELERRRRHSQNGKPKDAKPKDEKPKDAKPKDAKPKDAKPKDSRPDPQPNPQPKPQPNEGEA